MISKNRKVAAVTLGCKVNYYDTEAILEAFAKKGYEIVNFDEFAHVYIINTCTVTNIGDKKSRQMIRRAKTQNPEAVVCATGCYAQVNPEEVLGVEGVNICWGIKDRGKLIDAVENWFDSQRIEPVLYVEDIAKESIFEPLSVSQMKSRHRAYLKIQEGCDMFCSYCIIPYARGRVRSRNLSDILAETSRLSDAGYKEIVLTGIHVASYGKDFKERGEDITLLDVIKKCHEVDGIKRIRLSSLEPGVISESFVKEAQSLDKLCPHFHLSLQSGCDKTLKAMNRKYTTAQYEKAAALLREYIKDVSITTDMIAGFPGEGDGDFLESVRFAEKIGFYMIHVFPYARKTGTVAAKMPDQLDRKTKTERAKVLLDLGERLRSDYMRQFIGKPISVLFEEKLSDGRYIGQSGNYMPVVKKGTDIENTIIEAVPRSLSLEGGELCLLCDENVSGD